MTSSTWNFPFPMQTNWLKWVCVVCAKQIFVHLHSLLTSSNNSIRRRLYWLSYLTEKCLVVVGLIWTLSKRAAYLITTFNALLKSDRENYAKEISRRFNLSSFWASKLYLKRVVKTLRVQKNIAWDSRCLKVFCWICCHLWYTILINFILINWKLIV